MTHLKRTVFAWTLLAGLFCGATRVGGSTLDFSRAPVGLVLEGLCRQNGYNLVLNSGVTDTVSVYLDNMEFQEALDNLARVTSLDFSIVGKTLIVSGASLQSRLINLSYIDARSARDALLKFCSPKGRVEAFVGAGVGAAGGADPLGTGNTLLITDVPGNLEQIERMANALDRQPAQVEIEAKLVETSLSATEKLGIDWNLTVSANGSSMPTTFPFNKNATGGVFTPTPNTQSEGADGGSGAAAYPPGQVFPYPSPGAFVFGRLNASGLAATLDLLSKRGNTNLVSSPRVTTLDGRPASVLVGLTVPIALYERAKDTGITEVIGYDQQEIGMKLNVQPRVTADGKILLKVRPEVSEIVEYRGQFNERPVVRTRQAEAEIIVNDGETLVLGGMIQDLTRDTMSKVPILGDIPLLGFLFRHKGHTKEKLDLLVFVTPRIISPAGP